MAGHISQAMTAYGKVGALLALVAAEGSAGHAFPSSEALSRGPEAARNVADVIHHFCLLHGRHPGVIDHALSRADGDASREWLEPLADAFGHERALLTKLVVAVGPLPSTPGQANAEAAVLAQHHAIDMLAQSDRAGCALGAAIAVAADWAGLRPVLEHAAERLSIDIKPSYLPDPIALRAALDAMPPNPAMERAMMFGAQQIATQHRGLWDLLEARCLARQHADY